VPLGRQQNDLRSHDLTVRPGVLTRTPTKLDQLGLTQLDAVLAGHRHQDSLAT
jgi:hypothetical protein